MGGISNWPAALGSVRTLNLGFGFLSSFPLWFTVLVRTDRPSRFLLTEILIGAAGSGGTGSDLRCTRRVRFSSETLSLLISLVGRHPVMLASLNRWSCLTWSYPVRFWTGVRPVCAGRSVLSLGLGSLAGMRRSLSLKRAAVVRTPYYCTLLTLSMSGRPLCLFGRPFITMWSDAAFTGRTF